MLLALALLPSALAHLALYHDAMYGYVTVRTA
jgi:hypothetical protein